MIETACIPPRGSSLSDDWPGIVAAHGRMVFQAAYRILGSVQDAEHVAQDVFLEISPRTDFDRIKNLCACLRRLAVYRALDRRRKRKGVVGIGNDEFPTAGLSPVDEA